jgi:hypothetical protein
VTGALQVVQGSTALFAALYAVLLEQNKVAICCMVTRAGLPPSFVALMPEARAL